MSILSKYKQLNYIEIQIILLDMNIICVRITQRLPPNREILSTDASFVLDTMCDILYKQVTSNA